MSVASYVDGRMPKLVFAHGSRMVCDDRKELISIQVDLMEELEEEVYFDVPSEVEADRMEK